MDECPGTCDLFWDEDLLETSTELQWDFEGIEFETENPDIQDVYFVGKGFVTHL